MIEYEAELAVSFIDRVLTFFVLIKIDESQGMV